MKNKIELKLRKLLSGKLYGQFKSFFKGEGLEIQDFRQYQLGDDTKAINWKVSAKFSKFYINLFRQEKDVDLHLFFDVNVNWQGGEERSSQYIIYDYIVDFVLFCRKYGGKLKGIYFDKGERRFVHINKDHSKAYFLIDSLKKIIKKSSFKYRTNLSAFIAYEKKITKRRIIVIFSDLLGLDEKMIKTLNVLSEKNELFIFRIPVSKSIGINYNIFNTKIESIMETKQLKIISI